MAAPTMDGFATGVANNAATVTATLTTTNANDIICALFYVAVNSGTKPTINSVTASGLTFQRRAQSSGSPRGRIELWWAVASSALSSKTITVNVTGTYDDAALLVFGVNGCNLTNPWDSNASLPKTASSNAEMTFTGISTSGANNLLLFLGGTNGGQTTNPPPPAGFTFIGRAFTNAGVSWGVSVGNQKGVTSQQNNATFSWPNALLSAQNSAGNSPDQEYIFDSLTADATSASTIVLPQVFVCT